MATELATAYVSLVPSAKGFGRQIQNELGDFDGMGTDAGKRFGSGFGASLSTAVKGVAVTVGAAFAFDFTKDAIGQASDLSESIAKNGEVFGDASDEVLDFAKTAGRSLGQSKRQALEATGVFGNLLRSVGQAPDAAAEMSTSLTALASDLASFNNVPVDDALNALRSGLVGETEPLKRFGVNLNEAALKAKALELGLSDGKTTLDANAKSQAAYALIMEQTSLAQGDFARTSDGLANQQKILSAQFEDAKASLGNALLPVMTTAVNFINDTVIPGFRDLAQVFDEEGLGGVLSRVAGEFRDALPVVGAALGEFGAAIVQWVTDNAPVFAEKVLELGAALVDWVAPQIPPLLEELGKLLVDAGEWILSDGIPLLAEGIGALASALIDWVANDAIPGLLGKDGAMWKFLEDFGTWIAEDGVDAFLEAGKDLGEALIDGLVEAFKDIPTPLEAILDALGGDPDIDARIRAIEGGREHGGPVFAGSAYVVGEKRPELFVPKTNGYIVPEVPAGLGSGATVNIGTLVAPIGDTSATAIARELRRQQLLVA